MRMLLLEMFVSMELMNFVATKPGLAHPPCDSHVDVVDCVTSSLMMSDDKTENLSLSRKKAASVVRGEF